MTLVSTNAWSLRMTWSRSASVRASCDGTSSMVVTPLPTLTIEEAPFSEADASWLLLPLPLPLCARPAWPLAGETGEMDMGTLLPGGRMTIELRVCNRLLDREPRRRVGWLEFENRVRRP